MLIKFLLAGWLTKNHWNVCFFSMQVEILKETELTGSIIKKNTAAKNQDRLQKRWFPGIHFQVRPWSWRMRPSFPSWMRCPSWKSPNEVAGTFWNGTFSQKKIWEMMMEIVFKNNKGQDDVLGFWIVEMMLISYIFGWWRVSFLVGWRWVWNG